MPDRPTATCSVGEWTFLRRTFSAILGAVAGCLAGITVGFA